MSISAFANAKEPAGLNGYTSTRRQYRELKRIEAAERQEAFDAEVAKTVREQNCLPETARDVVQARRRFEQRLIARMLANPLVSEVRL